MGMLEIYLDSVGRTVSELLVRSGESPDAWPTIESFFKSRHFGEVPHHAIIISLFALLREQAQSSIGQPTNIKKQVERSKNDLNDAGFISIVLPYVTDILVDTKFADLLSKPKMSKFVKNKRVWSPRRTADLIREADDAIQSVDFQMVDDLYRHLAPLEENEFVPREPDEMIIYDGQIR